MTPTRRRAARAFVLLSLVAGVLAGVHPALAAALAVARADSSATAGSWGVAAAAVGGAPVVGQSFTVQWVPATTVYFDVVNTGTVALSGTTWTGTNSKASNGAAPPEVAFDACVGGTWNTTTGTCSGTVSRVAATSGGTFTVASTTTARTPGGRLSVRGTVVSLTNFPHTYSTALGFSVTRGQTRAATTTSS